MKRVFAFLLALTLMFTTAFTNVTYAEENTTEGTGYTAYLGYSDESWWPGTSGDVNTTVTGEGTYTLTWNVPDTCEGTMAFYINIVDGYEALKDIPVTAVKVLVDGTEVAVNMDNLYCFEYSNTDDSGAVTETGYQILFYNFYGSGTNAVEPIATINSTLEVSFTLGEAEENNPVDISSAVVSLSSTSET